MIKLGRLGSRVPALGIKTLSDLQIDVDKDWRAHGIYNLGDLTPKVDGAYNIGSSTAEFDTIYAKAGPPPGADSIGREELKEPAVDTAYLYDNAATSAKVGPSVDLEFVRSNDNVIAGGITPKVDGAYNLGTSANKFDTAYANNIVPAAETLIHRSTNDFAANIDGAATSSIPAAYFEESWAAGFGASIFDNAYLSVSKAADIAYQSELLPVKFADVFDHANLGSAKAKDIIYHANFNLPSTEARDKVVESTYGMAADQTGVKGLSKQVTEKRDFAFRTETPNHAYWHRMYNTPAAFETVYQDYTTSMQHKGTTPSKSAPNTADPNPQPGACWSVSMLPDGTQVGGFASPALGMGWDGVYLWYTDITADYVYQVKTDGTQVGGFAPPAVDPAGAAWDGAYLWVPSRAADYIYHLKTDGTQVGGFASIGTDSHGITWDGTYLWNVERTAGYAYQLKKDGTQVGSFSLPAPDPVGITWDGAYHWHADEDAAYIYQLKTDGTQVGGFVSPAPNPHGVAWDGSYLWNNILAGYIYQLGNAGNFDVNYRIFAK